MNDTIRPFGHLVKPLPMNYGKRLREERERLGLTQEAMGQIGGVRKRAQLHYEHCERRPDIDYLAALAGAGVDVLYVITGRRVPVC